MKTSYQKESFCLVLGKKNMTKLITVKADRVERMCTMDETANSVISV